MIKPRLALHFVYCTVTVW